MELLPDPEVLLGDRRGQERASTRALRQSTHRPNGADDEAPHARVGARAKNERRCGQADQTVPRQASTHTIKAEKLAFAQLSKVLAYYSHRRSSQVEVCAVFE